MLLPKNIGELTVKQFQALTIIYNSNKDLLDKGVEALALLTGLTEDEILKKDHREVKLAFEHINNLLSQKPIEVLRKWIVANGKAYKAVTDLSKVTAGQYLDLKNLSKDDKWIENMHLLLGCVYMPVSWYGSAKRYDGSKLKEVSEDLLKAKVKDVYGLLFFYSNVLESLNPIIQMSLEEAIKTIQETVTEMNNVSQGS